MLATKSLVYKIAKFNDESNPRTLQQRLEKALEKHKTALSRRQGGSENLFRLINYNGPYEGMRVGEMFDYTSGARQPTAEMDDKATELTLDSVAPPNDKSEFLHSILYFAVRKNSVLISQSSSLRSLQLEEYLIWLLRSANELSDDDYVALCDQPPSGFGDRLKGTKKVTFSSPVKLVTNNNEEKSTLGRGATTEKISVSPGGKAWDYLKNLLPDEFRLPTEISADDIISRRSLELSLTLSWNKVMQDDPTDFMDAISNELRHVETELDYAIETKSGSLTRDDLKLRKRITVQESKGLIVKHSMWGKMHEWLNELVTSGIIELETEGD